MKKQVLAKSKQGPNKSKITKDYRTSDVNKKQT